MVFTSQPSFHKLVTHNVTLDLDILQYTIFSDLINSTEILDIVFDVHNTQDHKGENELYRALNIFEVEHIVQNLDSSLYRESHQSTMLDCKP